jgi:hypothetical protein
MALFRQRCTVCTVLQHHQHLATIKFKSRSVTKPARTTSPVPKYKPPGFGSISQDFNVIGVCRFFRHFLTMLQNVHYSASSSTFTSSCHCAYSVMTVNTMIQCHTVNCGDNWVFHVSVNSRGGGKRFKEMYNSDLAID